MSPWGDEDGGRLDRALTGLVADGRLEAQQADLVREAYARAGDGVAAASEARPVSARIPEVLGYLGGAFVVAAVLLVLGWSWSDFSYPTRLLVATLAAVATFGAGLAIAAVAPGGARSLPAAEHSSRRRLVGVLLVAGAFIASGAVSLVLDHSGDQVLGGAALVVLVLGTVAVRVAPGVVPTGGLFVASVMAVSALSDLPDDLAELTWVLAFLGLGLLWAVLGPWLSRTAEAALALGLGTLVVASWVAAAFRPYEPGPYDLRPVPHEWGEDVVRPLGLTVLGILAVVGVLVYLRGGGWPWMAAGTTAAVGLVVELTGDAFGPAVAALVAGVVLLAASGLLVLRRGRGARGPVSGPGP